MTFTATFAEDDNMFRLAETAITGQVDDRVQQVLHYFAGDRAEVAAERLVAAGQRAGLADIDAIVCSSGTELTDVLPRTDVLVTESVPVAAADLAASDGRLAAVQKFGTVIDGIDTARAAELGVKVRTFRRRTNISCAEHTIALLFAAARRLPEAQRRVVDVAAVTGRPPTATGDVHNRFNWAGMDDIALLHGATLGLLGFGEIAREVASRALAMGMEVLYHKRTPVPPDALPARLRSVEAVSFEDLLTRSDAVSIHLPGDSSTDRLVDEAALTRMKPTATLINMSRGCIVDEAALEAALREGRLRAAGLDVHREEPVPADSGLLSLPNVAWSPHIASGGASYVLDEVEQLVETLGALRAELNEPEAT